MEVKEKIGRPSPLLLLLESRAFLEFSVQMVGLPLLQMMANIPKGDGHPILVLPGFVASDRSTRVLRSYLKQLGYQPYPWELGRNWANYEDLEDLMNERVKHLRAKYGRKVSLIGWSLGGVYAREIARKQPHAVRQIITMGSPFRGIGQDSNASWVYEMISGRKNQDIDPELLARFTQAPPVPTTAIYTRTDGIVSWKHCLEKHTGPMTENIEVIGSHCGLGHNPMVLLHIAERLSQQEGDWMPFRERYGMIA